MELLPPSLQVRCISRSKQICYLFFAVHRTDFDGTCSNPQSWNARFRHRNVRFRPRTKLHVSHFEVNQDWNLTSRLIIGSKQEFLLVNCKGAIMSVMSNFFFCWIMICWKVSRTDVKSRIFNAFCSRSDVFYPSRQKNRKVRVTRYTKIYAYDNQGNIFPVIPFTFLYQICRQTHHPRMAPKHN